MFGHYPNADQKTIDSLKEQQEKLEKLVEELKSQGKDSSGAWMNADRAAARVSIAINSKNGEKESGAVKSYAPTRSIGCGR